MNAKSVIRFKLRLFIPKLLIIFARFCFDFAHRYTRFFSSYLSLYRSRYMHVHTSTLTHKILTDILLVLSFFSDMAALTKPIERALNYRTHTHRFAEKHTLTHAHTYAYKSTNQSIKQAILRELSRFCYPFYATINTTDVDNNYCFLFFNSIRWPFFHTE